MSKPILFNAPMVRAVLEGRKTQTRRIIKPQPHIRPELHEQIDGTQFWCVFNGDEVGYRVRVPYAEGDLMWVREAWASDVRNDGIKPSLISQDEPVWFAADGSSVNTTSLSMRSSKTRPSIFMPRWASRITLEVTEVRVERLKEISETEAISEGCTGFVSMDGEDGTSPREEYQVLWDSIHGSRAWDKNPWVAAYTFGVVLQNIDRRQTGGR